MNPLQKFDETLMILEQEAQNLSGLGEHISKVGELLEKYQDTIDKLEASRSLIEDTKKSQEDFNKILLSKIGDGPEVIKKQLSSLVDTIEATLRNLRSDQTEQARDVRKLLESTNDEMKRFSKDIEYIVKSKIDETRNDLRRLLEEERQKNQRNLQETEKNIETGIKSIQTTVIATGAIITVIMFFVLLKAIGLIG
ncbi:hypothetical protein GVN20_08165 [Runella sp. CRIBMP]|uniref:hypothetical protein n=1 Tax=Runella sp. CRIBMP TaxID=2683261 RepID=UPI001412FFF7|nr:hypothetical protein [Runella sp. CRIBMP]NBB19323.1 hypothetical protein [Runella sp. CRIBMP]